LWSQTAIDQDTGWWTIPAHKAKNKLPHRVPLSPLAKEILKDIAAQSGASPYVFPTPFKKKRSNYEVTPLCETTLAHAIRDNLAVLGLENVRPHDLRRTAASHMTSIGIPRLVVSKILNHAESGVTAVYDRHSYDAEKRKALNAWGKKITAIVNQLDDEGDSKVVPLHG
jgi:integrase